MQLNNYILQLFLAFNAPSFPLYSVRVRMELSEQFITWRFFPLFKSSCVTEFPLMFKLKNIGSWAKLFGRFVDILLSLMSSICRVWIRFISSGIEL